MSLVSEALKKAEREAAEREARAKGLPVPLETPLQPFRARRRGGGSIFGAPHLLPILALVGTVAALVIAFQLVRQEKEGKASVKEATEEAPAPVSAQVPTVTSAPGSEPAPALPHGAAQSSPTELSASEAIPAEEGRLPLPKPASQPPPEPPSASESTAAQPPNPPLPKTASQPSSTAPRVSESEAPKPVPPPPAAAGGRTGDYLRHVEVPDGTKLELGGIVYSEEAPFAYLNGRLVGVGEFVEGFRIDRIERERVHLSGDAGTIRIRLKGP